MKKKLRFIVLFVAVTFFVSAANSQHYPEIVYDMYKDSWNLVSYRTVDDPDKRAYYSEILKEEMSKYPEKYYEKINLKKIVIAQNLDFDGTYRAAIPDYGQGILFMGISDTYTDDYFRHCFHHEQQHYAEYSHWKDWRYNWDKWEKLYDGNYEGGEIAYLEGNEDLNYHYRNDIPGFINTYSMLGQEEDRAEIIGYFMNDKGNERELFMMKAKNDTLFHEKALLLFNLLANEFDFPEILETYKKQYNAKTTNH